MVADTLNEWSDPGSHGYCTNATLRFENTRDIPSARCQNQSTLLNWETVSRLVPVVKLLSIRDNYCSSSMACSG